MEGPVYIRFGRLATPVLFDESHEFTVGKASVLKDGTDVTIIAAGLLVNEALIACDMLAGEGISARVINMHTIKPLDTEAVIKAARETGAIVTAEEHTVIGGLGAAVSEAVCETCPVPVVKIGIEDEFGYSGPADELLTRFGLRAKDIAEKAKKAIALKK